jgi:hypothetical protein
MMILSFMPSADLGGQVCTTMPVLIDRVLKLSTPASTPSAASNLDSPDVHSSVASIIGTSHHTQIVW